jgi:hypothetical protein
MVDASRFGHGMEKFSGLGGWHAGIKSEGENFIA